MYTFTRDGWKIKPRKVSPMKFNTLTYLTFCQPQKFNPRNLICVQYIYAYPYPLTR